MKDKATFQNKVKVLNKLFDSGCDTEKKLQQLDMEAILKIPNITIPDMGVIMELQKNTKSVCSVIKYNILKRKIFGRHISVLVVIMQNEKHIIIPRHRAFL